MAVSQKGEVFSWGYNGFGQLGIGSYSNQCTPQKAQLHDVFVKEVRIQRRYDTVDLYSRVNSNDLIQLAFQALDQIAAFLSTCTVVA